MQRKDGKAKVFGTADCESCNRSFKKRSPRNRFCGRANCERYRIRQNGASWRAENPDAQKAINRRRNYAKYGVTPEWYEEQFAAREGKCDCCHETCREKPGVLCIDHCHQTGHIRGLLCKACNSGIGQLRDNRLGVLNAYRYLERAAESMTT